VIGSVSTNRRAHAFAQLLDDDEEAAAGGPVDGLGDAPTLSALSVVHQLAALPRPSLSDEARVAQRARLTAAAEAAHAPAAPGPVPKAEPQLPEQRQRRRRGGRGAHRAVPVSAMARLWPRTRLSKGLAASGLTMGVAAGALGGVAAASTDALPGDTLYGLKRGMEDLRLDFAGDDVDRGEVYLDRAATRLNEARRLMERARSGQLAPEDLDEVRHALSSMRDDAAEGHRLLSQAYEADGSLAAVRTLSAFTDNNGDTWARLRERLPVELDDISADVNGVFDAIEDEIAPLKPLLPEEPEATGTADATTGRDEATTTPAADTSPPATGHPTTPADTPPPDPSGTGGGASLGGGTATPGPTWRHEGDGLLDGTGILDPGTIGGAATTDPGTQTPTTPVLQPDRGLPKPDVTIPPLVDDLLPDLGLDVPRGD
jgi:hypothetical protein